MATTFFHINILWVWLLSQETSIGKFSISNRNHSQKIH